MDTSVELRVSPRRIAMIAGAVTAVTMLIFFTTGLQLAGWIAFACGIYYGMKYFRTEIGGYISYARALVAGIQTAFFTSFILAFVCYVAVRLDPSAISKTLDLMEQQLRTYNLPQDVVEMTMQQWREILSPVVLMFCTVFTVSFTGSVTGTVCAFFVRKEQPQPAGKF